MQRRRGQATLAAAAPHPPLRRRSSRSSRRRSSSSSSQGSHFCLPGQPMWHAWRAWQQRLWPGTIWPALWAGPLPRSAWQQRRLPMKVRTSPWLHAAGCPFERCPSGDARLSAGGAVAHACKPAEGTPTWLPAGLLPRTQAAPHLAPPSPFTHSAPPNSSLPPACPVCRRPEERHPQRVGGPGGGLPAHAGGGRPPGGAHPADHRAQPPAGLPAGRAVGLRPLHRPAHPRPAHGAAQGPLPAGKHERAVGSKCGAGWPLDRRQCGGGMGRAWSRPACTSLLVAVEFFFFSHK